LPAVERFLVGAGAGAGMILLVTLGLFLLKAIAVVPGPDRAEARHLLYTNPLFMLAVVAVEELLFRSALVGWLSGRIGVPLAISASALVTFLLHLPNGSPSVINFVNSSLFTVVASQFYLSKGYPAALGFHWAWNLTQWTALGYPMYGRAVGRWLHVVPVGPPWLTGAAHGPENGLLTGVVLAMGAALLALAHLSP
jgi:membrane protease YdiL (CAAX protease family)